LARNLCSVQNSNEHNKDSFYVCYLKKNTAKVHFSLLFRHFLPAISALALPIYTHVSGNSPPQPQALLPLAPAPTILLQTPPAKTPSSAAVEIPPHRRTNHSNAGFTGVRLRPGGCFVAEISAAGVRVWLSTFNSKEEASRAYDATAWRFARPRHQMNFS
jgi:hypothetical protein